MLGPILFLLFIDNLPNRLNCKTRLFADDCLVYTQVNNQDDCISLQEDLNQLAPSSAVGEDLGMEFHPGKCYILSITRSRTPRSCNYNKLKGQQGGEQRPWVPEKESEISQALNQSRRLHDLSTPSPRVLLLGVEPVQRRTHQQN